MCVFGSDLFMWSQRTTSSKKKGKDAGSTIAACNEHPRNVRVEEQVSDKSVRRDVHRDGCVCGSQSSSDGGPGCTHTQQPLC